METLLNLIPGQVFATKYRVVRLIKSGGMGAVYEVQHVANDKRWALKIMKPELTGDAEARERFEREAKIDTLIDSVFVVSVIDAGVDEATSTPYLVMEYLVGEELGARSNRVGPMPSAEVVRLLGMVARALDKAHARKIVHRDLKPDNLFVVHTEEDGERIKVLDFGIAKLLSSSSRAVDASTHAGGTPMYMAPEQTRRTREIGPWTDIWALGLIAYTLLVGRPYWEGEALGEVIREIIDEAPREPPSARAKWSHITLSPAFDAWFLRCVDNEPSKRFASAGEAIARLREVFESSTEAPSPAAETLPADALAQKTPPPIAIVHTTGPVTAEVLDEARNAPSPNAETKPPPTVDANAEPIAKEKKPFPFAIVFSAGAFLMMLVVAKSVLTDHGAAPIAAVSASAASPSGLRAVIEQGDPFLPAGGITLQRTEITRGAYASYLATLGDAAAKAVPLHDWPDAPEPKRPITWVTWTQASAFCSAIGARLPTVLEWKAASQPGPYPWGATWPPRIAELGVARELVTLDVATSPLDHTTAGHFDLFGNVSEWTATSQSGFATVIGASAPTSLTDAKDMFAIGAQKIVGDGEPEERADAFVGFRCAR